MSESALVEALEWALAEIEGRTLYSSPEQRENCLELAHAALRGRATNNTISEETGR